MPFLEHLTAEVLFNTFAFGTIALLNLATGILAFKTSRLAVKTNLNMMKVELATNSMKDALVAATAKASFAAGHEKAQTEGEARAATLARGMLAGASLATPAPENVAAVAAAIPKSTPTPTPSPEPSPVAAAASAATKAALEQSNQ